MFRTLDRKQLVLIDRPMPTGNIIMPKVEPLPKLNMYVPIKRNFLGKSEKKLKNMPYLGEKGKYEKLSVHYKDAGPSLIAKDLDDYTFKELILRLDQGSSLDEFKEVHGTLSTFMSPKELKKHFEKLCPQNSPPTNENEDRVDVFMKYFCIQCLIYGCKKHESDMKPPKKVKAVAKPCGLDCYKVNGEGSTSKQPDWSPSEKIAFAEAKMITTDVCLIAGRINKKCHEVRKYSMTFGGSSEAPGVTSVRSKTSQKRKSKSTVKETHVKNVHSKEYSPCPCEGDCGADCPCDKSQNFCEKFCGCAKTCSNRFPGCRCQKNCSTNQCICFLAKRECDPDQCHCDMAVNNPQCHNLSIQRQEWKHLLLGPSSYSGWGIFTKNDIKKDDFISVS
jgi:hypothetical protein